LEDKPTASRSAPKSRLRTQNIKKVKAITNFIIEKGVRGGDSGAEPPAVELSYP
jgi:hypothetical protein